jgi:hypothetical protein
MQECSRRLQEAHHQGKARATTSWPHVLASRPLWVPTVNLLATSVLHRLNDCISAIYLSQFDLRAED